ncbi:MAG: hypothetical protein MJ215_07455 [Spirochaetia bacterium]|nr:hypothetical protein [Spirochaetia bacterium]
MSHIRKLIFLLIFISILLSQAAADSLESLQDRLSGSWIRDEENNIRIIYFGTTDNELTLYNRNEALEETYKWSSVTKSRQPDTLNISGTNDMIPIIKMIFTVQFTSDDTILLYSSEAGIKNESIGWNGEYRRMREKTAENMTKPDLPELNGEFTGEAIRLDFHGDSFTLHDAGKDSQGRFTVYQADEIQVLELQFCTQAGVYEKTEYYAFEYETEINDEKQELKQTLTLRKGKMTPTGFVPAGDEETILTNISEITSDRDTGASQEILDPAD